MRNIRSILTIATLLFLTKVVLSQDTQVQLTTWGLNTEFYGESRRAGLRVFQKNDKFHDVYYEKGKDIESLIRDYKSQKEHTDLRTFALANDKEWLYGILVSANPVFSFKFTCGTCGTAENIFRLDSISVKTIYFSDKMGEYLIAKDVHRFTIEVNNEVGVKTFKLTDKQSYVFPNSIGVVELRLVRKTELNAKTDTSGEYRLNLKFCFTIGNNQKKCLDTGEFSVYL